jgi:hypothetical protein
MTSTVPVNILTPPTISIAGSNTTCAGYLVTYTASGGQSYLWSNLTTGSTYTSIATTNTVIGVVGIGANTCSNVATVSIAVSPTPNVNVGTTQTAVCAGQSTTLNASGSAVSYSWNGVAGGTSFNATPSSTGIYTVAGSNTLGCVTTKTIAITVYPLPSLTVTPSRTGICNKEKVTLTASGAANYTWVTQGVLTPSVIVTPTIAQTYTFDVIMSSSDGCLVTGSYQLVVSACTGLNEAVISPIKVFPNPSGGDINISSTEALTVDLCNELGQKVRSYELGSANDHTIKLENLSPGIYFLKGESASGSFSSKVIITKQ